jgi:peptidoglycan hydrolase CwlO-like protein
MTTVTRSGKVWEVEIERLVDRIVALNQSIAVNRERFVELKAALKHAKEELTKIKSEAAADTSESVDIRKLYGVRAAETIVAPHASRVEP